MVQYFICKPLIGFELERIQNLSESLSIFIALDHSIATFYLICRSIILSIILRVLPKCTTLDLILY
jgi:hypothetical protein